MCLITLRCIWDEQGASSHPSSYPSHGHCFASCLCSCLQHILQARGERGAPHQPAHARTTLLPEQVAKLQQTGCLIRNFKDLSPFPPFLYFYCSLWNTPIFCPSLTVVNAAVSKNSWPKSKQQQPPQLIFSSPSPFSSEPRGETLP